MRLNQTTEDMYRNATTSSISLILNHHGFNSIARSVQMKWYQNVIHHCTLMILTLDSSINVTQSCIGSATES